MSAPNRTQGSKGEPSVAIIILNWNKKNDTLKCLESVFRLKYKTFEVMVVDNGSGDGSAEVIAERYPGVILVAIARNIGFSAGNNAAIRLAIKRKHDYVLLLNDDSTVDEDLLDEFVTKAESDGMIAALGAKILCMEDDSKTWSAYGEMTYGHNSTRICGLGEPSDRYRVSKEVDWVVGCGMFLRVSAIEKIGFLDENLFSYYEDLEWCNRARKNGYRIVFHPAAIVHHLGSQSWGSGLENPDKLYLHFRNMLYCVLKHGSAYEKIKFFSIFFTFTPAWELVTGNIRLPRFARAYLIATIDVFAGRPNRIWLKRSGLGEESAVTADLIRVHVPKA